MGDRLRPVLAATRGVLRWASAAATHASQPECSAGCAAWPREFGAHGDHVYESRGSGTVEMLVRLTAVTCPQPEHSAGWGKQLRQSFYRTRQILYI